MGAESRCQVRFGKQTSEGKALLETSELIFRGDFRLVIPFREMRGVKATDGALHLQFSGSEAVFQLGPLAAKWANKILHPKSVVEKLGVKAGSRAALIGMRDPEFAADLNKIARCSTRLGRDAELVFLGAKSAAELKHLPQIRKSLAPNGALWIVYPKGQTAIREIDVLTAGRKAGLVDIKVVGFSQTDTALKFVIPSAKR